VSERKQNQFGFYYDDCGCLECQYVRGHIVIAPQGEVLPHQWGGHYAGPPAQDNANRLASKNNNDAPYAFWLGANA
jgi:hypothetical protein